MYLNLLQNYHKWPNTISATFGDDLKLNSICSIVNKDYLQKYDDVFFILKFVFPC